MKKVLLFSASILALTASPSLAIDAPKGNEADTYKNTVFKLGEIAVSVVDETTTVGSRNVISAEEIQAYTDTDTLEKAIVLLPGVDASKVGRKNETSVSIRGFEMRQVNVMLDGIQSATPYDYYPDLRRYSTSGLSEVQVSKGLSSALAGPNTMGGIINMVTKRPTKTFEGDISLTAKMGRTGAYNGMLSSTNIGGKTDNWFVQANASYNDISRWSVSDKYRPVANTGDKFTQAGQNSYFPLVNENGGFRNNSASKDLNVNLKVGYTPNETDEYVIGYSYLDADMEIPVYAGQSLIKMSLNGGKKPSADDITAFQLTKPFYRDYPYYKKQSLYALTNTAFGETGYVKTKLFYDTYKNEMTSTFFANAALSDVYMESGYPSYFDDYDYGLTIETGADLFDNNTTKAAFHYRRDVHRSHGVDRSFILDSNKNVIGVASETIEPTAEDSDDTYSIALENIWHANDKTDVIVGASYDWLVPYKSENYTGSAMENLHQQKDNAFNPMIAIRYRYSDTGTAYAGIAQKSRFATLKSRYGTRQGNKTGIPNPYLKAEHAINYEIGFSDTFANRFRVDAAAFYSAVRDTQIETAVQTSTTCSNMTDGSCYQTQNLGRSNIYGFELASMSKITSNFDLGLAYTFMIKELESQTAKDRDLKPTNAPRHKLTVYGDYRPIEQISVIPSLTAYSSRYSTIGGNNVVNGAVQTNGSQIGTGLNNKDGTKIGGFATAGLKVLYKPMTDFEITVGVDNIFDKNYELTEGYPEEGRNYFITLTKKF